MELYCNELKFSLSGFSECMGQMVCVHDGINSVCMAICWVYHSGPAVLYGPAILLPAGGKSVISTLSSLALGPCVFRDGPPTAQNTLPSELGLSFCLGLLSDSLQFRGDGVSETVCFQMGAICSRSTSRKHSYWDCVVECEEKTMCTASFLKVL